MASKFDIADLFALAIGSLGWALYLGPGQPSDTVLRVSTYFLLLGTSSVVVTQGLEQFTGEAIGASEDIDRDTGWLIGKLENILLLTFVFQNAYVALSIIFAAKSLVRREDTSSENTSYYLAGTLLNFTYSIIIGLVAIEILAP